MKTTKDEFLRLAKEYTVIPVYMEALADTETPVSVLGRLAERENVLLLESVEGGETWGRYSFIGVDPVPFLEDDHSSSGSSGEEGLAKIRRIYSGERPAIIPGLPRFCGGIVGCVGYEAVAEFEKALPPKPAKGRELKSKFLRVDNLVVFDNIRHTLKIIVCVHPEDHESPEVAYQSALDRIDEIYAAIKQPFAGGEAGTYPSVDLVSSMSRDEFCSMVERAREYICAGDIIQVVLSRKFEGKTDIPPFQLYRALRLLNPSPYMFFLKMGDHTLVGSSPEVMVRLTGSRVELRPIAGTKPRGKTEQEDRRLADELLSDEKEKAEHVMLVDLGRNDVGRVSETGSVQVREYMIIERYSHVMHIVSHVEGVLKKGADAFDVLSATFPAGTLSGAPKVRAMEIINELEKEPRGVYGGAVGYVGYDGNMDFAITIRTMEISKKVVTVQAGAGIVYNSVPETEYEETMHKAQGMRKAVDLAAKGLVI